MSTFLGSLSPGSCWVKAICSFLGFVHCRERGREQALPHCVTLGSPRAALSVVPRSVLELHSASLVHSKQIDLNEIPFLSGVHAELQLAA